MPNKCKKNVKLMPNWQRSKDVKPHIKTLSSILEDQNILREKLINYIKKNPSSIAPLAKKIKIDEMALHRFVIKGRPMRIENLFKIQEFFEEMGDKS